MSTGSDAWMRIGRAHSLTVFGLAPATICVYSSSVTLVLIDRVRREMEVMARLDGECRATSRSRSELALISAGSPGVTARGLRRNRKSHSTRAKPRSLSEFPNENRGLHTEPRGG